MKRFFMMLIYLVCFLSLAPALHSGEPFKVAR